MANILLIEDSDVGRKELERVLREQGHQVIGLPTVDQGCHLLRHGYFHCVVVNLRTPGCAGTGLDLAKEHPWLPVIIYSDNDVQSEAEALGARFVSKASEEGRIENMPQTVQRILDEWKTQPAAGAEPEPGPSP